MLENSKKHLNKDGRLFFPVISLSDVHGLLNRAKDIFNNVELLCKEDWPLPQDMYQHIDLLESMKEDNGVQFDNKFGILVCHTYVYVAYD